MRFTKGFAACAAYRYGMSQYPYVFLYSWPARCGMAYLALSRRRQCIYAQMCLKIFIQRRKATVWSRRPLLPRPPSSKNKFCTAACHGNVSLCAKQRKNKAHFEKKKGLDASQSNCQPQRCHAMYTRPIYTSTRESAFPQCHDTVPRCIPK